MMSIVFVLILYEFQIINVLSMCVCEVKLHPQDSWCKLITVQVTVQIIYSVRTVIVVGIDYNFTIGYWIWDQVHYRLIIN